MYRSTNHLRPGLADFGAACGMAVLRTNLDAAPGLDVGLELHSRPGPNLRWNGVVEIQASADARPWRHSCRFLHQGGGISCGLRDSKRATANGSHSTRKPKVFVLGGGICGGRTSQAGAGSTVDV